MKLFKFMFFFANVGYNGRVFSVVGYIREGFPPMWYTTEEVFSVVGYNGEQPQDG